MFFIFSVGHMQKRHRLKWWLSRMQTQGRKKKRKRKKTPEERTIIVQKIIIGLLVFISCCLAACLVIQQLSASKYNSEINDKLRVALSNLDDAKRENTVLTYEMNSMRSLFQRGYSLENPEAILPYLDEGDEVIEYSEWSPDTISDATDIAYYYEEETTEPEEYLEYYGFQEE